MLNEAELEDFNIESRLLMVSKLSHSESKAKSLGSKATKIRDFMHEPE